jgi:hypothetical protein
MEQQGFMSAGLPSRSPDAFFDEPLEIAGNTAKPSTANIPLTQDEIAALREFFLLLDKWDRQKRIA